MNTPPESRISEKGGRGAVRNPRPGSPGEFIDALRDYVSTDFPNPDRAGCPGSDALYAPLRSGTLPGGELREHLFKCSECFREYREALAEREAASPSRRGGLLDAVPRFLRAFGEASGRALAGRAVLIPSGLLALLLIALGVWYVWPGRSEPAPVVVENIPPPPPAAPRETPAAVRPEPEPGSTPAEKPTVKRTPPARRPHVTGRSLPAEVAQVSVKIDLNGLNSSGASDPLRGLKPETNDGAKVIRLLPARTRLSISLPEGSAAGTYSVSIIDAFGKTLTTDTARSRDGKKLHVSLDLTGLRQSGHSLCVSREEELRDCYPVVIGDAGPARR